MAEQQHPLLKRGKDLLKVNAPQKSLPLNNKSSEEGEDTTLTLMQLAESATKKLKTGIPCEDETRFRKKMNLSLRQISHGWW